MKKDKSGSHRGLRYLPFIAIAILAVFLYYDILSTPYCLRPCYGLGPSRSQKSLQYTEIIIFLSVVMIAISLLLKFYTHKSLIAMVLLILFWLFMLFFDGVPLELTCPVQCTFSPNFTCVTSKLYSGTSELMLFLGNNIRHKIKVNGAKCIRTDGWNTDTPNFINPLNNSILLNSQSSSPISGWNTSNKIYCTNSDGSIPNDIPPGTLACLTVYINYTDMITGESNITYGRLVVNYER